MPNAFAEKDWQYLKSIRDELLFALCSRINRECATILASQGETEYARYQRLYKCVHEADDLVAECFDDWRRSTIAQRVCSINRQGLLKPKHLEHLTPAAQKYISTVASL